MRRIGRFWFGVGNGCCGHCVVCEESYVSDVGRGLYEFLSFLGSRCERCHFSVEYLSVTSQAEVGVGDFSSFMVHCCACSGSEESSSEEF